MNQGEQDVDCGGPCNSCPEAQTCSDGILNQDETDIDCGGTCRSCLNNRECTNNSDCISRWCIDNVCVNPPCSDGIKNYDELGIDCGGICRPCKENELGGVGVTGYIGSSPVASLFFLALLIAISLLSYRKGRLDGIMKKESELVDLLLEERGVGS